MSFRAFPIERLEIIHNLNIELCSRFVWVIIGLTAAVPEKQPDNRYNEGMIEKTMTKITCPDGRPSWKNDASFYGFFVWEWVCLEC